MALSTGVGDGHLLTHSNVQASSLVNLFDTFAACKRKSTKRPAIYVFPPKVPAQLLSPNQSNTQLFTWSPNFNPSCFRQACDTFLWNKQKREQSALKLRCEHFFCLASHASKKMETNAHTVSPTHLNASPCAINAPQCVPKTESIESPVRYLSSDLFLPFIILMWKLPCLNK